MARRNWRFKNCTTNMSKHHRCKHGDKRRHKPEYIEIVPETMHDSYHHLFQDMEPPAIAALLNDVFINPDWVLVAKKIEWPKKPNTHEIDLGNVNNHCP